MFLARRLILHHIKLLLQKKATEKWYRAVYCEHLNGRSEWYSVAPHQGSEHAPVAETLANR
jgi:hypothetical protein